MIERPLPDCPANGPPTDEGRAANQCRTLGNLAERVVGLDDQRRQQVVA
jgi:hypothetical protein